MALRLPLTTNRTTAVQWCDGETYPRYSYHHDDCRATQSPPRILQLRPVESSAVPSRQHQIPIVRWRGRSPDRTMAQEPSTTVRQVRLDCAMEHHATKRRSHGTKSSPAGRRNANFVDTSTDSTEPRRSKAQDPKPKQLKRARGADLKGPRPRD